MINPEKTLHSASTPSLSEVDSSNNSSANNAAETTVPVQKYIENTFSSSDELPEFSYGQNGNILCF